MSKLCVVDSNDSASNALLGGVGMLAVVPMALEAARRIHWPRREVMCDALVLSSYPFEEKPAY